ncbi:hypothetical protein RHMOL_Rhmol08G0067400 [Rhododendron molle]|uniref:Uncharacterized protein n=1 Tax=Rhododendron molle TaxID=49168 RepID=A0ACC0MKF4_RHOML|nr:hypothetical protein RHMOL_Rhmol08G0067400 [Rhododendron molle]
MSFVAVAKETKWEMEGRFSVLSTPSGTPSIFFGKGSSIMEASVSERESEMNGRFAGVVKKVTVTLRWRSS